jgi:hypothetical protein
LSIIDFVDEIYLVDLVYLLLVLRVGAGPHAVLVVREVRCVRTVRHCVVDRFHDGGHHLADVRRQHFIVTGF